MGFSPYLKSYYKSSKCFKYFVHIFIGQFRLVQNMVFLVIQKLSYKKRKLNIAFVGPIHSQHFLNFTRKFFEVWSKNLFNIIQISSDPNSLKKSTFFSDIIIDGSIYTLFGYSMSKKEWEKSLFLYARNKISKLAVWYIELKIKFFKPDILWVHDLQAGGYLTLNFINELKKINPRITLCASVYGNDLYFFESVPCHFNKLRLIMGNLDFIHVESEREKSIALNLGFNGRFFPVSNVTMTDIESFTFLEFKYQEIIKDIYVVIKGSYFWRSNFLGFLTSVERDYLFWKNKRMYVLNATDEDIFHITRIKYSYNLDIDYCRSIPHREYISLLARSRYFLTLNLSDGIPNACAEATYVNCIPVFSNHTGLTSSLSKRARNLIVFDFGTVDFGVLFSTLEELLDQDRLCLIDNLKKIFRDKLYNKATQNDIIKEVVTVSKEKLGFGSIV